MDSSIDPVQVGRVQALEAQRLQIADMSPQERRIVELRQRLGEVVRTPFQDHEAVAIYNACVSFALERAEVSSPATAITPLLPVSIHEQLVRMGAFHKRTTTEIRESSATIETIESSGMINITPPG